MPSDKLEKLKELLKLLQNDTLTPSEVRQFLTTVLETIKKSKDEFQNLSAETKQVVNSLLQKTLDENAKLERNVSSETSQVKKEVLAELSAKMKEIKSLMKEVEKMKPQDGKDADETKIVEDVLSKIPKAEPFVLKRLEVVEEINRGEKNSLKIERTQVAGLDSLVDETRLNRAISILDQRTQFLINRPNSGGGGGTWGSITGTLSTQIDLQNALNAKQDTLLSGTTIKTINSASLLGSGDIALAPALGADDNYVTDAQLVVISNTSGVNTGDNAANSQYSGLATSKQDTLISGTNIKTVGGTSLLGSGNISVGTGTVTIVSVATANGVSGVVATDTTTPAITLTLGAITPTSTNGVSSATMAFLDATSSVQTQLNAKAPLTAPTFATSITGSYLTASQLLGTDGSKNIVSLAVATYPSLTELTYLKGVTSAIQAQINAKGAGTVTVVSVVTANGVSGSVATDTTTPAITLTLGAITPTTVNGNTFTTGSSTYTGTAAQTYTFPSATDTITGIAATQSLTNKSLTNPKIYLAINAQTNDYTLALTDASDLVDMNKASTVTLTVPTNASIAFPIGTSILIRKLGVGDVVIAHAGGVTIQTSSGTSTITTQYNFASLIKTATNTWTLSIGEVTGVANTALSNLSAAAINTTLLPGTDDGAGLGNATHNFSDLFLASGAVINYANSNVVLTHTSGVLTLTTGTLALGANNLTMTGSLGATAARLTKGWFTDLQVTNAIAGSITGTATAIASGSANIPAFSAYATGNTTLATSTRTIIAFAAKEFDIGTYYSTSTNLYTPLKAGIYRLSAAITLTTAVALSNYGIEVWKNGAFYKNGTVQNETTTNAELHLTVSCLVSMNGSTDTLSIYGFNGNAVTACTVYGATGYTFFECNYVGPAS